MAKQKQGNDILKLKCCMLLCHNMHKHTEIISHSLPNQLHLQSVRLQSPCYTYAVIHQVCHGLRICIKNEGCCYSLRLGFKSTENRWEMLAAIFKNKLSGTNLVFQEERATDTKIVLQKNLQCKILNFLVILFMRVTSRFRHNSPVYRMYVLKLWNCKVIFPFQQQK